MVEENDDAGEIDRLDGLLEIRDAGDAGETDRTDVVSEDQDTSSTGENDCMDEFSEVARTQSSCRRKRTKEAGAILRVGRPHVTGRWLDRWGRVGRNIFRHLLHSPLIFLKYHGMEAVNTDQTDVGDAGDAGEADGMDDLSEVVEAGVSDRLDAVLEIGIVLRGRH